VIWDLGVCPKFNLEFASSSYGHLTKIRNLKAKDFQSLTAELNLLISDSD